MNETSASFWAIGRLLAITIIMILVIIRMNVLSEKRLELSQTITSLSGCIRMEKGCKRCDFCQNIEDENRFFLLEEWDTRENLMTHLKSEHSMVLRGAMNLLHESYETLLYHRSTSAINTKVETNSGEVTLYGKASNAAEVTLVTKLANDVNGVKGVSNRMTIE